MIAQRMSGLKLAPLFLLSFVQLTVYCDYVGQSVRGEVGEGNYTYYSLRQTGRLKLVLTSLEGDADLYVSSEVERPTYQLEEHFTSSATCGQDLVVVSKEMRRPVNIAVYGHPRYDLSRYLLQVVVVESLPFDPFDEDAADRGDGGGEHGAAGGEEDEEEEETPSRIVWSVLKQVLQILVEIMIGIA